MKMEQKAAMMYAVKTDCRVNDTYMLSQGMSSFNQSASNSTYFMSHYSIS